MKSFKSILILVLAAALPVLLSAQNSTVRKETRKGNREYKAQKYDRAEVNYLRALHQDSNAYRAQYNLGNTLYRQQKYNEAINHFDKALAQPGLSDKERSRILHNRGNSYLKAGLQKENRAEGMQQFQQAVNDYQEALKLAPKNDDTRYNLSTAATRRWTKPRQQRQKQGQKQGSKPARQQRARQSERPTAATKQTTATTEPESAAKPTRPPATKATEKATATKKARC